MTASVQIRVPDLSLYFNEDAEPAPAFHLYLDPDSDSALHSNADPDPQPCCKIRFQLFSIVGPNLVNREAHSDP